MKCKNLARGNWGCSKKSPTLLCPAERKPRHPSLRSGQRPLSLR